MTSYRELIQDIRRAVRNRTATLPTLQGNNGCIRILFRPLCPEADAWSGGFGFEENDIPEYETVFTLKPNGSHTVMENGHPVNCYGFSALKVASCSKNRAHHGIRLSYSDQSKSNPDIVPMNGFANFRGCTCYTIMQLRRDSNGIEREINWARIYIAVSGGASEEDEKAACSAFQTIQKAFSDEKTYRVV